MTDPIMEVVNLTRLYGYSRWREFWGGTASLAGVRNIDFKLYEGKTLALIGESGSGKSTLARVVLGLERANSGSVQFQGKPLKEMTKQEYRLYRRSVQPIFQDPSASLNPRHRVFDILASGMLYHRMCDPGNVRNAAVEQLNQVGLSPGSKYLDRYPSQLSGGQQQRVAIARAFSLNPSVVVADEALSSLDVSVQSQVLRLIKDLQNRTGVAYLFISHDIWTTKAFADDVMVMCDGNVVEAGEAKTVLTQPQEDYTKALLDSGFTLPV